MYSANFYTVKTNGQEIIRDHKSALQIKVYELDREKFNPNPAEIVFYNNNADDPLAFETVDCNSFSLSLIAYALSWYVDYTEQFAMRISITDPRLNDLKLA